MTGVQTCALPISKKILETASTKVKTAATTTQAKATEVKKVNQEISALETKKITQVQTEKAIASRIESTNQALVKAQKAYENLKAQVTTLQTKYNNAKTTANKAALAAQLAERKAALSKALADKALAAYNQAKKTGKLVATSAPEPNPESDGLFPASDADVLKKQAEEALKQYQADQKAAAEARALAEKAANEFKDNQSKLKSTVVSAKVIETQVKAAQSKLAKEKSMLEQTVATKEEINKKISAAQVALNTKKVELIKAETEKAKLVNDARKASEILSSNVDLYKSHQEVINATNNAIDAVNEASQDIQKTRDKLKEFNPVNTKNIITRNIPQIVGVTLIFAATFFTVTARTRNKRKGATQTDLGTSIDPEPFDVDIKRNRSRSNVEVADKEFEEYLNNMRIRNAKLMTDIEKEFTPGTSGFADLASKPKVTKKRASTKKSTKSSKAKTAPTKKSVTKKKSSPKKNNRSK